MTSPTARISCPVCAAQIEENPLYCSVCNTPHHADCLAFFGRCAVFGCASTTFLPAPTDPLVSTLEGDQLPTPVQQASRGRRSLQRGVFSRGAYSLGLAMNSKEVIVPVGLLLFLSFATNIPLLSGLGIVFARSMAVIIFSTRARGKEFRVRDAVSFAADRFGRIFVECLVAGLCCMIPLGAGLGLLVVGAQTDTPVLGLVALVLLLLALERATAYALVPIVAAMHELEEPGPALPRSSALVSTGKLQAGLSLFVFLLTSLALGTFLDGIPKALALTCTEVLATTYWVVFYLEARTAVRPTPSSSPEAAQD